VTIRIQGKWCFESGSRLGEIVLEHFSMSANSDAIRKP
jgi:hypothetical protein